MNRGTKPQLPHLRAESAFRADRGDFNVVELESTDESPQMPDWLTAAGQEVWMDDITRVSSNKLISEADTTAFANYCNLQGMIILHWRDNVCPPVSSLIEARKFQEYFGIMGAKSRVVKIDKSSDGPNGNPYNRFKRRM